MRVYVIGCGGMLGDYVYNHFTLQGHEVLATDIKLTSSWIEYQDICHYNSLVAGINHFQPNIIMNLAAVTDLEEAELSPITTMSTNALGSAHCATIADTLNIPYVYISTAGIFDGEQETYDDADIPKPLGVYAKTKYLGEKFAQQTSKHIVLRCGWQTGSGPKDKKFIQKIWQQIKHGAKELNVVNDKQGTPTYVKDFTLQIEKMIHTNSYGVFNSVGKGRASRYDVALEFVRLLGLQDKIKINIVPSSFWQDQFYAPRPASEILVTSKLDSMGLNVMRTWQESLADYITEYKNYFTLDGI